MQNTLKRFSLLVIAILSCLCVALCFAACNTDDGSNSAPKTTYSVTVTTDASDLTLTDIKAQWRNGTEAASDEIALDAEGKASVELDEGVYTVTLIGVPSGYSFSEVIVSARMPSATINITKDAPLTATYTVNLSLPSGETLPDDVKVQLYKGETPVGTATAFSGNSATVTAEKGEYTVKITGLPEYLTYTPATVSDTAATANINVTYAELTYTVRVESNAEGTELSGVKAELWKDEDKVDESELNADGVAVFTATAGTYSVKLSGLDDSYAYEEATLTKTETEVTITVTVNSITVTVKTYENTKDVTLSSLTVQLMSDETQVDSQHPDESGVVVFTAPKAEYTVKLEGLDENFECQPVTVGADENEATLEITETLEKQTRADESEAKYYAMSTEGKYTSLDIESVDFYGLFKYEMLEIEFTPEKAATYTFTWQAEDTISFDYMDTRPSETQTGNSAVFILRENQKLVFTLSSSKEVSEAGIKIPFDLVITSAAFPEHGSSYDPFEFEYNEPEGSSEEYTIKDKTYTVESSEAYFALKYVYHSDDIFWSESVFGYYTITADEGVTVYAINSYGDSTQLSADQLKRFLIDSSYDVRQLHFVSTAESFEFTISAYVYKEEGAKTNPKIITLDAEVSFTFEMNSQTYLPEAWFKFTATEAGDYYIDNILNLSELFIYKDSADGDIIKTAFGYDFSSRVITLEADTTYYFALSNVGGVTITFKIIKPSAENMPEGSFFNPIEAKEGKTEIGSYNDKTEDSNGEYIDKYFTFTATKSGAVIITAGGFDYGPTNLSLKFFSDAKFENLIDSYGGYGSRWKTGDYSDSTYYIESGTTLYINARIDFYNPASQADEQIYFTIELLDSATAIVKDSPTVTVEGVTGDWQFAYYSYTVEKGIRGNVYVMFGGFESSDGASVYLTVSSDKKTAYGNSGSYSTEVTDAKTQYLTFAVDTIDENDGAITFYMVMDYKSANISSFKFTVETLSESDLAKTATEGENTAGAGRETLQFREFTFTAEEAGTMTITAQSEAIVSISRYVNYQYENYLNTPVEVSGEVTFTVYWLGGDGDVKFNLAFVPYTEMKIGDNDLAAAETEEKTVKFKFTPEETGYYTFTISDGVDATLTLLDGDQLPKIFSGKQTVIISVTYSATGATVSAPKLTVTKLSEKAITAAGETEITQKAELIKFTAPEDGIYLISVSGAKNCELNIYNTDYDAISVFHLAKDAVVLIAVEYSDASETVKLNIVEATVEEISTEETAISGVTETAQTKVYKFSPAKASKYEFSVTGTNVTASIALYDKDYSPVNGTKAAASAENYVYVMVTYKAQGGAASDVKLIAKESTAIQATIGMYGPEEFVAIGAVSTENELSVTLEASFSDNSDLSTFGLYLVFAEDKDGYNTIWDDQIDIISIKVTGDDGGAFEDFGYYIYQGSGNPTSVTIELTFKLAVGQPLDNIYVGVGADYIY